MREFHVLNLGAGVQSTTLYLLDERCGHGGTLRFDVAIFADTQAEPRAVYDHLEWLKTAGGPPIWVRTRGSLEADLMVGQNARGGLFASIPCYTAEKHELRDALVKTDEGQVKRQCTSDYKIEVIGRAIRRELVGLKPRQRMPKDVLVHQYYGISVDEVRRMGRIRERWNSVPWVSTHFPLIDMGWSRRGCESWLKLLGAIPHEVPRSACVFCPFRNDREWKRLKDDAPEDWQRAVNFDRALRVPGNVVNRNMDESLYLHRSCIPLEMVDFDNLPPQTLEPFTLYDCVGMCGV